MLLTVFGCFEFITSIGYNYMQLMNRNQSTTTVEWKSSVALIQCISINFFQKQFNWNSSSQRILYDGFQEHRRTLSSCCHQGGVNMSIQLSVNLEMHRAKQFSTVLSGHALGVCSYLMLINNSPLFSWCSLNCSRNESFTSCMSFVLNFHASGGPSYYVQSL